MVMRTRAEKNMRKHLVAQLKARKILGARVAQGDKSAEELDKLGFAPQIFLFKNLFSGQVLYSKVPAYHQDQIDEQFVAPNWQNRKPSRRNDLWKIMCIANFANFEYSNAAYEGLVQLRKVRDVEQKKEAQAMRKKNDDGNIWYSGQYRPTYSQEAVADLSHVIDEFQLENTKLLWENDWRRGDDKYWRDDLVEHFNLPTYNPKYQTVMLDLVREKARAEFEALRQQQENSEALQS